MPKKFTLTIPKDPWFFISIVLGIIFLFSLPTRGFTSLTGFFVANEKTSDNVILPSVKLSVIYDSNCTSCYDASLHVLGLSRLGVNISKVEKFDVSNGSYNLINKYNITSLPTITLSKEFKDYKNTQVYALMNNYGTFESDGSYVFRRNDLLRQPYEYLSNGSWVFYNPFEFTTGENETKLKVFVVADCPFCKLWWKEILPKFVDDFGADVVEPHYLINYDGKNFSSMHGQLEMEHNKYLLCAQNQSILSWYNLVTCYVNTSNFTECVNNNVNLTMLNNCLNDTKFISNSFIDDNSLVKEWDVRGTPWFFVNYKGKATVISPMWLDSQRNGNYIAFKSEFCKVINNSLGACS